MNKVHVHTPEPVNSNEQPTRIERAKSVTQRQGAATLTWLKNMTAGQVSPLVDVGKWAAYDPDVARVVRVTFQAQNPLPLGPFNPVGPSPGAMALITYQGQNGVQVKRWVPCPCDFTIVASQVRVQAVAVGLPYQALPSNCFPNANNTAGLVNVTVTFGDESGDEFPSMPLYPQTFLTGGGSAIGATGRAPLIASLGATVNGASGFLRGLQITNGTASPIFVVAMDNAPNDNSASAASFLTYSTFGPIAVLAGNTILRAFDDLPFIFQPFVAALSSVSAPAFADGTNVYVEADYAPIATPGF